MWCNKNFKRNLCSVLRTFYPYIERNQWKWKFFKTFKQELLYRYEQKKLFILCWYRNVDSIVNTDCINFVNNNSNFHKRKRNVSLNFLITLNFNINEKRKTIIWNFFSWNYSPQKSYIKMKIKSIFLFFFSFLNNLKSFIQTKLNSNFLLFLA